MGGGGRPGFPAFELAGLPRNPIFPRCLSSGAKTKKPPNRAARSDGFFKVMIFVIGLSFQVCGGLVRGVLTFAWAFSVLS